MPFACLDTFFEHAHWPKFTKLPIKPKTERKDNPKITESGK